MLLNNGMNSCFRQHGSANDGLRWRSHHQDLIQDQLVINLTVFELFHVYAIPIADLKLMRSNLNNGKDGLIGLKDPISGLKRPDHLVPNIRRFFNFILDEVGSANKAR
uniref:Uncharacterized protein n=1 Tax=Opuntia streptacantha TaxID=393608 RepID=A0A7C9DGG8_OPUST